MPAEDKLDLEAARKLDHVQAQLTAPEHQTIIRGAGNWQAPTFTD